MTKITTYNRGIIIDGHADTKEECETITLLCNSLAKDENFKQVAYDDGYAAFEKIGKAERLRFVKSGISVIFDSNITKVTCVMGDTTTSATTSGETIVVGIADADFTVELAPGYELATAVSEAGSTITITGNSFHYDWKVGSTNDTITLTSKAASTTGETWELNPEWHGNSYNFTGLSFLSNGETFSSIKVVGDDGGDTINYDDKYIVYCQDDGYVNWAAGSAYATITFLTPPTGTLLTWLQENGTKQPSKLSVDLTTLSSWSNLSSGSNTIKIVAKGTGYRDSEKSAGVNVTKPSNGYTVTITYGGLVSNVCFYSLDNGLTWIDGYVEGQSKLVLNNVKQIKFKAEDDGHSYAGIYSTLLNVSLHSGYNDGPKYSENFTLTQDVNDVQFNSGAD